MNKMKPEDVLKALEEWIYNFQGTSTQFCTLCDAITVLRAYQSENAQKDAEIEGLKVRLNGLWEANDLLWDGGRKVCHEVIAAYTEMAKRRLPIISPSVFDSLAKDVLEGKK